MPKSWTNNDYTYSYIDTYKSNKVKIGMNEMRVNDSEICARWNNEKKDMLKDQRQVRLIYLKEWRDEQRDEDQIGDIDEW